MVTENRLCTGLSTGIGDRGSCKQGNADFLEKYAEWMNNPEAYLIAESSALKPLENPDCYIDRDGPQSCIHERDKYKPGFLRATAKRMPEKGRPNGSPGGEEALGSNPR